MDKRLEIREAIDTYTDDGCLFPDRSCNALGGGFCTSGEEAYKCLMEKLSNIGCVLKVDRELPIEAIRDFPPANIVEIRTAYLNAGYVAAEPLMAEGRSET